MVASTAVAPPVIDMIDGIDGSLEALDNPYPEFAALRDLGPVVAVRRRNLLFYHVNGWSEGSGVLNDQRFSKEQEHLFAAVAATGQTAAEAGFVLSGVGKRNLLNSDPPDHTRLRSLVAQAFSPAQIKALEPDIVRQIEMQLDGLSGRDEADLIADYAYPIAINMICAILGVPAVDKADFRIWATAASTPQMVPDAPVTQAEGAARLQSYLTEHIKRVRVRVAAGELGSDLLSAMAEAQLEGDTLSDDELQAMAFLLLIAGHETTVGLIGATLFRLGRETEQRQQLIDSPSLIDSAIEEFLRIDGPVLRTTFRVATEDVEVGGFLIPKGSITTVSLPTANRDPSRFDRADQYDVTRKGKPNLAFGSGPHFCLGRNLARSETKLAIAAFLQRFPEYTPGEVVWAKTVVRAPTSLFAKLGKEVR